jgi:hypothetical protein
MVYIKRIALIMVLMMMQGSLAGCSGVRLRLRHSQSGNRRNHLALIRSQGSVSRGDHPRFPELLAEKTDKKWCSQNPMPPRFTGQGYAGGLEADCGGPVFGSDIELLVDAGLITHPGRISPTEV